MASGDDLRRRKAQLELEEQLASAIKDSTASLEDFAQAQKKISENYKLIKLISLEVNALEEEKVGKTKEEIKEITKAQKALQQQQKLLVDINKELSKTKNFARAILNEFGGWSKQLKSTFIPSLNDVFQKFLSIDDLAHQTANTIGFQGSKFKLMNDNLSITRDQFSAYGFELEDAYKTQTALSEATGRQTMLTKEASKAIAETSRITGMATDEMGGLVGQMEAFGMGAKQSADFILQMSKESSDMGLNSGKVIKKFQENLGLLNKLNFKTGIAGLKAMTKFSEKYKLDMNAVASVADKVFRPEGAIEAAAQLQTLGGSLSTLGDPFQLMYKARNAPEELAKSLTKAATASATWDETTKEWKVNAYELDRMKEAASALGMDYQQLVETAKQGAKINQFEGLLGGKGLNKDTMDALTGAAQMGENGAFVTIKGDPVLLKDMTSSQAEMFVKQEATNKELAEKAMSVQNDFTRIKNEIMIAFVKIFEKIDWKMITNALLSIARIITGVVGWMNDTFGPGGTLAVLLGLYFGAKAAYWFINGRIMGVGFNSVAGKGLASKLGMGKQSSVSGGAKDFLKGQKGGATSPTSSLPDGKNMAGTAGGMSALGNAAGQALKIIAFAGAIYILAQALKVFNDVEWMSLAKGAVAIIGFGLALEFMQPILTSFTSTAWPGIVAMLALGGAILMIGGALNLMGQVPIANLIVGFLGLIGVLVAFSMLSLTGVGWAGVALVLALGAAMLMIGGAVYLVAMGISMVVDSFTNMFSVVSSENIGALLMLGPALIGISFGVFALAASLIALGIASWFGGVTAFSEIAEGAAVMASIDSSGISSAVSAINSVDLEKLEALKSLSLWMALLGGTTTVKFDESLHIDGTIELAGEGGGKSNTDWIKDPIFVSKLKELIRDSEESDRNGGKGR